MGVGRGYKDVAGWRQGVVRIVHQLFSSHFRSSWTYQVTLFVSASLSRCERQTWKRMRIVCSVSAKKDCRSTCEFCQVSGFSLNSEAGKHGDCSPHCFKKRCSDLHAFFQCVFHPFDRTKAISNTPYSQVPRIRRVWGHADLRRGTLNQRYLIVKRLNGKN